jgi:tRNA(Ile)-lysidine synthase
MLRAGRRLGVAVSGGADSVFLLDALRELGLAAAVLHVNHRLRGADSDADQAFVRALADQCGLPFHAAVSPVTEGNTEQEARRARYGFFADRIATGCCDAVATGHTLDDQAETVLSRFLRGSGTAGLSGIRPVTETGIVRPLLELRRDDIRRWLSERGMEWREDCSNSDTTFLRNRLRLDVMPRLTALNPALSPVLAATAEWARAEEDYWTRELDRLEPAYLMEDRQAVLISLGPFSFLDAAVERRLLRRAIEKVRGSLRGIDFRHVEAIRALTRTREGSGRMHLPDLDVYRSFDWLRLAPVGFDTRIARDFEMVLNVPGTTENAERQLTIEMELLSEPSVYNNQMDALDWDKCAGSLVLRNWRPGDAYRPSGKSTAVKIKTLFQEYRVPLWDRRTWPVVAAEGDAILWSRRFGAAEGFAAGSASERILLIREAGESKHGLSASMELAARYSVPQGSLERAVSRHYPQSGERGAEVL